MTERERRVRQRLKDDFPHYAERCLRIKPKEGAIVPLRLNVAQQRVHAALERQLTKSGMVRALLLKARQHGLSTLVEGRFYWKVTHRRGVSCYILTHETKATRNLFRMAKRYHKHCPEIVRPHIAYSNDTELVFDRLDSRYTVGTAGSRETGRSDTAQYFHGSEVALWKNAADHAAGVLQAIPRNPGTEIIFETTGRGVGNFFHLAWQDAVAGKGDFIPVFVPWFLDAGYRADPGEAFEPDEEERQLAATHALDDAQLAWRRIKLLELGGWRFRQEYPATPAEAFQSGNEDPLISPDLVAGAMARQAALSGRIVVAVDPARMGRDRTAILVRQGRRLLATVVVKKRDTMAVVGIVLRVFGEWRADHVYVDSIGIGAGVFDRLVELHVPATEVKAGDPAPTSDRFANVRAEMWDLAREWLLEGSIAGVDHADELAADLSAPSYDWDSNGRLRLESKERMAKRGVRSPDLGDALAISLIGPAIERSRSVSVMVF